MRRTLHWMALGLFSAAAILVILLVLAGVSLRTKRHEAGAPEPVTPRVFMIRNFLSDIYAARLGPRVIVFDAGMDPEARALELLVDSLGTDLSAVTDIFLTHGHFDHVAAARRCPNARIHIGAADADVLAHRTPARAVVPRLFGKLLGVPALEASDRLVGVRSVDVGGGESVLAVPLPGHTPGSYAYLFDGVLFTGDALYVSEGHMALSEPDDAELEHATCDGVSQLGMLFRQNRINQVCTGHRGCTPALDTSQLLETISLAAKPLCPG
ncbi:MAG TPA: MBL fold metallo-hydrolase [Polyangiaceae bacterium]|jgi:glyoxylase-like metal-dependent hydrolase (beta-lactamase superfamily II)|nr:MBL fold metallo-hydrolase [Polyangiaceae bacterium]